MSVPPRLILASASPRRQELLARLVPDFEVVPADVDERLERGPLIDAVARLALRKARAVADRRTAGVVLAADTIVVIDNEALGKPTDAAEARAMLRRLRGRTHEVMTGIAVVDVPTRRQDSDAVVSRITMHDASDGEIADYVATGEPLDKAGAYAIQGGGAALVASLEGSRTNVVGLPLAATAALLRRFGVAVSAPRER